jgi:uncharacterized membrane protein YfcA
VTLALALTLFVLGTAGAFVAGLLGVGGAIVMIPLLLYVPSFLGVGTLDMKSVAGITMAQVFVAAVSGTIAHRRGRAVHGPLVWIGGVSMAGGSLVGALVSKYMSQRFLLLVFALMATAATGLVAVRMESLELPIFADHVRFSRPRAAVVSLGVGLGAGLVGAGGAFLLVPLLVGLVGIPLRVTIGSSLGITALASAAGLAGKIITWQVPWPLALTVAVGAVPGAQLGARVSRRIPTRLLKATLFVIVAATAVGTWWDLLTR